MIARGFSSLVLVLLALAAGLLFSPFQTDAAVIKSFAACALALAGVAALALRVGSDSDPAARAGLARALLAAGPLLLAALASAALADFHPLARCRLADVGVSCAVVALAASAPAGERDARRTAMALAAAGAVAALYGAAQVFGIDFLRWSGSGSRAYLFRSTFGHHSLAAAFLLAALPPAMALALSRSASRALSAAALAASLVLAAGLFLSLGRGAWIGFAAATAVLAALVLTRVRRSGDARPGAAVFLALAAPAFLVAAASLAIEEGAERWESAADLDSGTVRSRFLIYEDTLAMVRERPLLGHGLGQFVVEYPRFRSEASHRNLEAGDLVVDHAHNEFLEVAAEQGAAGVAAFLWFIGFVVVAALRRRPFRAIDAGSLAAIAGLLVHNLFDVTLREASTAVPFALAAGFLLRPSAESRKPRGDASAVARSLGILAAIAALAAIAWPVSRARLDADLMRASLLPPSAERAAALQEVADAAPDWPEALYRAAYAQLREAVSGGSDAAKAAALPFAVRGFESLRRLAPHWANMPLPLAQAYQLSKRGSDALEAAREFARIHPFDSTGLRFLADLLEREEKLREALFSAERASASAPFDVEAILHVARLRESLGMNVEASAAFSDAIALAPRRADLRLAFARTAVGETQIDARLESLFIALQFSRGKPAALNLLSPAILLLRSPVPGDRRTEYLAAILARFRGDRAEAFARYESFASWAGDRADARVAPAVELEKVGDPERADALLDEAEAEIWARVDPWRLVELATAPNASAADFGAIRDPETRFRLGQALARNGRRGAALDVWREAAVAGRPLRLVTAARIAEAEGRTDEARAFLDAAAAAAETGRIEAGDDAAHGAIRFAETTLGPRLDVANRTPESLDRRIAGAAVVEPWDLYLRASWRETLGLRSDAIADYRALLALDPRHWLALDALRRLGADASAEDAAARRALARDGDAGAAEAKATIDVGRPEALRHLGSGWSRPEFLPDETRARWALGPVAQALVEVPGGAETIEIDAIACEGLAATMTVIVAGKTVGRSPLVSTLQRFRFDLGPHGIEAGKALVELRFDRFASPRERALGRSADGWPKAAGVKRIRVR